MTDPEGIKAGKISKPYGIRGEVQLILFPDKAQHITEGNPLFIDLDDQRVPYFMELVDIVSDDQAIIKLEFIDTVEEARKVAGCNVYLDPILAPEPKEDLEEFQKVVGYLAVDLKLGTIGTINAYLPQELNPVWIIEASGKEIIIPATHDFVVSEDRENKILHLDLPEGITEL